MTADSPANPSSDPGRWIRAALVLFPAGTVLLGIASFGIWQWNKDREADRSFQYAQALKREISLGGLEKHENLLRGVLKQPDAMQAVPGYLRSTMGEENMGYTVRRQRYDSTAGEHALVDAELSGKRMPREIVLVLAPYAAGDESGARALAVMLGIAHEVTGMARLRTLRFAALPAGEVSWKMLADQMREGGERLMQVHVLGEPPANLDAVLNTKATGTVVETITLPATTLDAVTLAQSLKQKLLEESGEP
ncbi:MAG: hypothetical protein JNG86_18355 [Verrucomicrobiaceae bacterium]|nr:hypothetical protein [Verrucomicrobiaceae bacterium]